MSNDGKPEWEGVNNPKHRHMAVRCNGHKRNGERCQKPAMKGATVCRTHGGATRHVQRKARQRLDEAADRMARQLLGIADSAESEAVRLAAIRDALDRAGLKAPTTVDLSVGKQKPWEEMVSGVTVVSRAESRAQRGVPDSAPAAPPWTSPGLPGGSRPEVVDAEVVPEGPEMGPDDHTGDMPRQRGGYGPRASAQPSNEPLNYEPRNELMTLEEANATIARANRQAGVHPTRRVRYPR